MWLKDKLFALKLRGILNSQNSTKEKNVNNKAQSIAILFDESQISSPAEVQQYVNRWNSKGKKVETFRYVDVKEFTEDNQSDDKFCRKDLNWYGLPNSEKINSFVSKPFDILITINPEKKNYLHFLNAASKARFKIGLLPDELEFYDLILDCNQPDNVQKIFSDIQLTLNKLTI